MPYPLRTEHDCLNCGAQVEGRYCGNCGQENTVTRERLRFMFFDFLGSYITSFDNKFFKSMIPLLFKPGFLTNQYRAGRRTNYIHPFRLYIFISIFYFLLVGLVKSDHVIVEYHQVNNPVVVQDDTKASSEHQNTSQPWKKTGFGDVLQNEVINKFKSVDNYRNHQQSIPESQRDNFLSRFFIERIITVNQGGGDLNEKIAEGVAKKFPTVIFFMLPVFALFLKFFFRKEQLYYIEHLYHSVHIHSFVFLLLSLEILLGLIVPDSFEGYLRWVHIAIPVYIYVSSKNVYKQGAWSSAILLLLAGIGYGFFLTLFSVISVLLSIAAL